MLTDKNLGDMGIGEEVDPDKVCERYFSSGATDGNGLSLGFSDS